MAMAWLRFIKYLPYIIQIGKAVVDLLQEIEEIRTAKDVLKEAKKTGNTEPLKRMVARL